MAKPSPRETHKSPLGGGAEEAPEVTPAKFEIAYTTPKGGLMTQGVEGIALRWLEMGSGRYACIKRILHNYNKRRLRRLHALENRHNKKQKRKTFRSSFLAVRRGLELRSNRADTL